MAKTKRDTSVAAMAMAMGLSESTIYRDIRRGVSCDRRGGEVLLNREEYEGWRKDHNLSKERGRPKPEDPADLAAAKLAKLQEEVRIKRSQADRDERRAQVDRGSHQNLEQLRDMLTQFGACLKAGIERMQRRFGPAVAVEFNAIVEEYAAMVRKHAGGMGAG